jgi:hypothetical protein
MIRDVMGWLDGRLADDVRIEVAGSVARQFECQIVALVLNPIPLAGPIEEGLTGAVAEVELLEKAHEAGDIVEEKLVKRLKLLDRPVEIRHFDVLADDIANIAAREARAADTFVALRSVWSRACSSDPAGTCSCFPRQNGQVLRSIASSSRGMAAVN